MSKIAILFPGQGSQFVGMGKEFLESDSDAQALMATAEEISGFPLGKLCLEGPMEDLTRTLHLQPAITVLNLICWQAMAKAGVKGDFFAGHSLGEYSALHAAGVLSVEDTLKLVTERGRLMEREATANPGAMSAILKLGIKDVEEIVTACKDRGEVTAANYNSAQQIVISGAKEAVAAAGALAADKGGKAVPLPVSGAWHSKLIAGAIPDFEKAMAAVTFKPPQSTMLFNVTAAPESDPEAIRTIMSRQIAAMVRWYESIMNMYDQGATIFIEVGPKKVLTGLMKKLLPAGHDCTCLQVEDPASLATCLEKL
ncbi:MAG: [acyl-carrier-protein] S-malonyltransferase [Desulfobulbaceae bacterium]|nr:MAG: [acyl-carrier-protein] S-malonyltransferase [Desulfobulbaceae bacterium]